MTQIVRKYPKMSLYIQNGEPIARVRLKGGERHSKSFPGMSLEDAERAALEWYSKQPWAKGIMTGSKVSSVMGEYLSYIRMQNYPENTISTYESCNRCYVVPNIGDMAMRDVKPYNIVSMYNALMIQDAANGGGISPNTVSKLHGFLKGAFAWAKDMEIIDENPMSDGKVRKPKSIVSEATAYTDEQMARLLSSIKAAMHCVSWDSGNVLMRNVAFAAYLSLVTGMRRGEVCAMKMSDIAASREGCYIHVSSTAVRVKGKGVFRQSHTKTNLSRNVSITEEDMDVINSHIMWNVTRLGDSAFDKPLCTMDGKYMSPDMVSKTFAMMRDDIGLPEDTSFHTLRHTHATWLLMNGIDIKTIQERLGHAKIETTLAIYSHVLPGRDQAAASAFLKGICNISKNSIVRG